VDRIEVSSWIPGVWAFEETGVGLEEVGSLAIFWRGERFLCIGIAGEMFVAMLCK
jgi:hypothetical protein